MKSYLLASAMLVGALGTAANAATETIDLAFILDESGSVGTTNYSNAKTALINALNNNVPDPTTDREYRITVVSFAAGANVVVSDVWDSGGGGTDASITNAISGDSFTGGVTCYSCAFAALDATIGNIGDGVGIINMMTDGNPNRPSSDPNGLAEAEAEDLRDAGWDSLSFEAVDPVGSGSINTAFLASLGFDTGGVGGLPIINDPNNINDPLNQSFVLEISNFGASYEAAVSQKIQKVIDPDPIPVPMALPLLASGLGVIGLMGWRRRKAA